MNQPVNLYQNAWIDDNKKLYTVRIKKPFSEIEIYPSKQMNINLCDRTSISNFTILDEKDRKAFEYRRLAHKISNIKKRIQKQKNEIKVDKSTFQSLQAKHNFISQTASQTVVKCQQIKECIKKQEQDEPKNDINQLARQKQENDETLEDNNRKLNNYQEVETNQSEQKSNSDSVFQGDKNGEKNTTNYEWKKDKQVNKLKKSKRAMSFLKGKALGIQQLFYIIIFSILVCYLVRNYSHSN